VTYSIDTGKGMVLGMTAGPKSVSLRKSRSLSERTIFGRAFQGAKRVTVGATGMLTATGRACLPSIAKAVNTDALAGESVDGAKSAVVERENKINVTNRAGRMANISLPHEDPVEIKRV
jgi:hypothetical protein